MLDHNVFKGHHTQLMIPREGPMPDRLHAKNGKFSVPNANRNYEVMLANCHQQGRHMRVTGQVVFDLDYNDATANLTTESLAILISTALLVFLLLTMLAIRINWGTRADYEYERYGGFVSITTEEEEDEEQSQTDDDDNRNNTIDYHDEDEDTESEEHSLSLRIEQATLV